MTAVATLTGPDRRCRMPNQRVQRAGLAPLIKHPGGKRKIASVVAELLGHPSEVCELFAGGLGASLTAGIRPAVSAEAIPAIRALYTVLAEDPAPLWAALDALPESVNEAGYNAARKRFNAGGASDPALYVALNAWCFNGLARFNDTGGFSTAVGRSSSGEPLVRPSFEGQRAAYASPTGARPWKRRPLRG